MYDTRLVQQVLSYSPVIKVSNLSFKANLSMTIFPKSVPNIICLQIFRTFSRINRDVNKLRLKEYITWLMAYVILQSMFESVKIIINSPRVGRYVIKVTNLTTSYSCTAEANLPTFLNCTKRNEFVKENELSGVGSSGMGGGGWGWLKTKHSEGEIRG